MRNFAWNSSKEEFSTWKKIGEFIVFVEHYSIIIPLFRDSFHRIQTGDKLICICEYSRHSLIIYIYIYICTCVIFVDGWIRGKVNGAIAVVPACKRRGNREWRQPEIIGLLVRSGLIFSNKLHRACSRARCNNIHAHVQRTCCVSLTRYTTSCLLACARARARVYRVACNRVVNLLLRKAEYRWRPSCLSSELEIP